VKFDPDIVGRHAKVMDTLRLALILARSETPNSAYKARVLFESVEADLRQIWDQGTRLGLEVFESDPVLITVKMSSDELKGKLASTRKTLREHERLVHGKNVEVTLSKERKPGEVKARQKVAKALGPTMVAATAESLAVEDFESALDVIQNHLHKSPVRLKEWVIQRGDQPPMRIADSEALGLHAKAQAALKSYMQALVGALVHAREDYDSIKLGNSRTKLRILGFLGGAEDPGSFDKEVEQLIRLRDNTVDPMIDRGDYVGAFKVFMREKPEVERRVKAEADYDADLDTGYRRLATTMQVVTVALVALVPIAGEAALATLVVEGGVALGTATAAVAGTATAAGAGGAFVGEGSRQLVTGDYDAGKLGSRTFQGGVIGLSAAAPAVTRQVGGALESAGFGAAGGEFVANTAVGEAQNLLSGGDPGMGALTGGLGWGGGKLTTALPKTLQNPVTTKIAQTGVGAGVSAVTGGSALEGGVGAFVGSFAKPPGPGTTSEKPATTAAPSPAAPTPDVSTIPGTGIQPRLPAAPTPDVSTIPGTGIQPRLPAAPTPGPATAPGPGITPRTPAPVAGDAAPVPAPSAHSVAPTSVPAESVPAPSLAPSHGAGSADTAAPLPVAHADTPAAPPPARLGPNPSSVNSDIPHQPVKGRDLLPSSAVPANLAQTDRPALDHRAGQYELRQDLGPGGRSAAPSHPTAEYPKAEPNRFVDTGDKPVAGISASKTSIVIDSTTGKKFLFKPLEAEHQVGRATKRGILKGEQAPREVAGPMVAEQLGVEAAQGQLIEIDGKKGVLIEWQEKNTLRDLRIADEVAYKRLVESEQFRDAMTSLDALDYLINNLDRGLNTGNYLYEFQNGQLKLSVIDHGLTFTATKDRAEIAPFTRGLPEKYPPELVTKLEQLAANRTEFIEKLRPLVGDAAVEGFDHRLTVMINDMRAKNAGQI
jgi:hypothetical protein